MKHFLRPIEIDAEQHRRLERIAGECLDAARVQASDGTIIWQPDGSGHYSGMYMRDFCYAVEGAGRLMAPEEIAGAIDYLFSRQREDGLMPNRVEPDGGAVYVVNERNPALARPPTDNAQFAVKLVNAYVRLTGDCEFFLARRNALMDGMATVPLSEDGLVFVDHNEPHPAYGFTDTVGKTGEVLFSSLLYWEACLLLANMAQDAEDHDTAHTWFEAADHTGRVLPELLDGHSHMFRAASGDCDQVDLWGSAYAGVIRAASKSQTRRIAEFFFDNYEGCILRGCVRHLPGEESWERMLAEVPPGTYQNGGYWATPAGWVAMVLDKLDPETARMFVAEVIDELEEGQAPEWINNERRAVPLYVASAANVLGAVKGV
jgi:hypothetical protein